MGLDSITVNLDPGVDNLPYAAEVDVRDWVRLAEVMEKYGLGPNGAQIMAADLIGLRAIEVASVLHEFKTDYVFIDTPGQFELFTFREASRVIIDAFGRSDSFLLYLTDPVLGKSPSGLISSMLLATVTQFRHSLPFMGVLAKADLLSDSEVEKVSEMSGNPDVLMAALESEGISPQSVINAEFFKGLENIGAFTPLSPLSAVEMRGFEDVYTQVQMVFEGGEDLSPD